MLEEQGKPVVRETLCTADFAVAAAIPERYIPAPEQRMDLYRRIARVRTQEEGDDITDELIDRYGDPPVGVANLIAIALLRARAGRPGHHRVGAEGGQPALLPPPARLCQGGRRCAAWKSTRAASSFPPATSPICPCG